MQLYLRILQTLLYLLTYSTMEAIRQEKLYKWFNPVMHHIFTGTRPLVRLSGKYSGKWLLAIGKQRNWD